MKSRSFILLLVLCLLAPTVAARHVRDTLGQGATVHFSENRGQWEPNVLFRSQMRTTTLFVEHDAFTFVVQHPDNDNLKHFAPDFTQNGRYRQHSYRLHFEGADPSLVEGQEREAGYENYYLGRDRSRWATRVGTFLSVYYHRLYPGVDMKVYTARNAMKYDFVVQAGGDPSQIVLRYEAIEGARLQNGNLLIQTSVTDLVELAPYAYQFVDGEEREVEARFRLAKNAKGEYLVTFELGGYDKSLPLVIDPYLHFSTYTGSTADNWGTTSSFDSYKQTYTAGLVFGTGYPVSLGAYDGTYNGNADVGIFKFDTGGTQRLFATYLGGSLADMPHSMYVNSLDELLIFGTTGSSNFPVTPNAFDTTFNGGTPLQYEGSSTINFPNGSDLFITRFSADGTQLQASTFVGGAGNDGLNYRNSFDYNTIMLGNDSLYYNYGDGARGEIITDDLNNVYVGSTTTSLNFPVTANCVQNQHLGRQDGIVFKIDYNLSNILWSTYLGGYFDDAIYSIDCDSEYNLLVCGGTNSMNFPVTPGAYRTYYNGGSADGFVAKIDYHGVTLMASTFFGSAAYDQCYFVRCGKSDDVFLFGQTKASGSTLIYNANYNTPNSGQFLARFKPNLDSLRWSTVFGTGNGQPNISPTAFAADICNRVYLAGWGRIFCGYYLNGMTQPWNQNGTFGMAVTSDAYQGTTDAQDFYIMSMDANASGLVYATFFGEPHGSGTEGHDHVDGGTSRFDRMATLYQSVCASCGANNAFPTTLGAWSSDNNSNNCNNAIFRLGLSNDFPVADFLSDTAGCAPYTVQFHNAGRGTAYAWDFGDPNSSQNTSTAVEPSHTFTQPGVYSVSLVATMPGGCTEADTIVKQITVLGDTSYWLDTLSTCPGVSLQIGLLPTLGCSYRWFQGAVSDSSVANPYVSAIGTYGCLVSNGTCTDTVWQEVVVGEGRFHIIGDTASCSIPTQFTITSDNNIVSFVWSSNRDFSDTLNVHTDNSVFSFAPDSSAWYYIHTVDYLGCTKNDSIHLHFYKVVDSIAVTDPICPDDCNGSAELLVTSYAMPPFSFNWGNGWNNASTHNGLCDGSYTVNFIDANGCSVQSDYTVVAPQTPTIGKTVGHIHCHETCTGTIAVTVTGPSQYSLLWLDDNSTADTRSNLCPGSYVLQITDTNGCIVLDTTQILENVDIDINIVEQSLTCPDLCSGSATALATGGTAPYAYQWSNGEVTATAHALCEGMVLVSATDATGCIVTDSVNIDRLHSFDSLQLWADEYTLFNGESTTLHATHIPGASYHWEPSQPLDNPDAPDPNATLTDTTVFVLTVTDSAGCVYVDSLKINCITVNCGKPNILIPNAFTPNGDGKNDQLCFRGEYIREFHISIFTRWGELLYESDDINACWDGRYKNNWCMPGVYVYTCRIVCEGNIETTFKGDITLIR
ncbi:MAG: gliding motility-associated C-terminal domain-containing protein [Bacteroidales bacterium]|nr:gliding motility-associated C-terminal domain-containing protein [Bacteroidales bacterium]